MKAMDLKCFVIIATLLVATVTIGSFTDVKALTQSQEQSLSPKSFGSKTNVCGDRLCSEVLGEDSMVTNLEVMDLYPLSGDYFGVLVKVTADIEPIFDDVVYVTSDIDTRTLSVPFIAANSYDYAATTIRAFDPSTIEVVYSPAEAVAEIEEDVPTVMLTDLSNISDQENTYRVLFEVTVTDFNAKNIVVQVSSDVDSINYTIGGLFEENTQTNQVIMKALDPESVSVKIIDFEINK